MTKSGFPQETSENLPSESVSTKRGSSCLKSQYFGGINRRIMVQGQWGQKVLKILSEK
jgi:hypothetical protein